MWVTEGHEANTFQQLVKKVADYHFNAELSGDPRVKYLYHSEQRAPDDLKLKLEEEALLLVEGYRESELEDQAYRSECNSLIYDRL